MAEAVGRPLKQSKLTFFARTLPAGAPPEQRLGTEAVRLAPEVLDARREREEATAGQRRDDSLAASGHAQPDPGVRPVERPLADEAGTSGRGNLRGALQWPGRDLGLPAPAPPGAIRKQSAGPRGSYSSFTNEEKLRVVKKVEQYSGRVQSGIDAMHREEAQHFHAGRELKHQTVMNWCKQYKKDAACFNMPAKPRGAAHKSVLPAEAFALVKQALLDILGAGTQVTSKTLRPRLISLLRVKGYGHLLVDAGGTFKVSRSWIRKVCCKLGLSRRAAASAARELPADPEKLQLDSEPLQPAGVAALRAAAGPLPEGDGGNPAGTRGRGRGRGRGRAEGRGGRGSSKRSAAELEGGRASPAEAESGSEAPSEDSDAAPSESSDEDGDGGAGAPEPEIAELQAAVRTESSRPSRVPSRCQKH